MPSDRPPLTQDRLKELLHYDLETGHFTWLIRTNSRAAAGSRAGSPNSKGYILIEIDGVKRAAHRLAFLYMMGEIPSEVDHINRIKNDNSWPNLRPATRRENSGNKGLRSDNTSGHRGVTWDKQSGKWRADGTREGRTTHLGRFDNLEEAAAVADAWRKEHHGEFYSCIPNPETLSTNPEP